MSLKGFIKEKLLSFTVLVLALFTILVFLIPYNVEGFIAVISSSAAHRPMN